MLILFDIDDALLNHTAAMRAAAASVHRQFGQAATFDAFFARSLAAIARHYPLFLPGDLLYEGQRRARIREVIDWKITDEVANVIFSAYLTAYDQNWSLFACARPCLARLSRHRLGIISNGPSSEHRRKFEQTGISVHFECILVSEECACAKLAAEILLRACSLAGEPATNALFVGDLYDLDALGAREAGLHGVWLDREGHKLRHHVPPLIRTLAELPELIESEIIHCR